MDDPYVRPATPQALLHRAPDRPDASDIASSRPSKYIVLLLAPTSVAGKVQIATSVSKALSCPLYQGDSLHESSAKAATVGVGRTDDASRRARYQRMWLNKMTRTGLLFPEDSRPANEGFTGFGGLTSRRGSESSISSTISMDSGSVAGTSTASSVSGYDAGHPVKPSGGLSSHVNRPVFAMSEDERQRRANPALMVLTHSELEPWHKDAVCKATGDYGIGIIFVPLYKTNTKSYNEAAKNAEDELPLLRRLDPQTVSQFGSFDALRAAMRGDSGVERYGEGKAGTLNEEMSLEVDVQGSVENIIEEIARAVRNVMFA